MPVFVAEDLPPLVLPPIEYPGILAPAAKDININSDVMDMYLRQLLPGITRSGDDGNYGSCACYDVLCLQVRVSDMLCTAERPCAQHRHLLCGAARLYGA